MTAKSIFDTLGQNYDLYVDWNRRLAAEIPFLTKLLRSSGNAKKILDVGCATGMHAIELAKQGYEVFGIDESESLIEKAKKNCLENKIYIPFQVLSMIDIEKHPAKPFDSVVMLGNIISFLEDEDQAVHFFKSAMNVLKTGGHLIVQTANYRRMLLEGNRFELVTTCNSDLMFMKVYDLDPKKAKLSVLMVEKNSCWQMKSVTQPIMVLNKEDLVRFASRTKYASICLYGKLDGSSFKGESSDQLVAVFRK
jgi:glycine/sarcosine N-methyltransferase/sarcosine/dimethylglycine N-methyltransferase